MKDISKDLIAQVSDQAVIPKGVAYNVREDAKSVGRYSTPKIRIEPKEGGAGLDIFVKAGTKGESVYIPALITQSGIDDLAYNDFHIGQDTDITIVAGCGVHTDTDQGSRHDGIHRFFLEENARVLYLEKHIGLGAGRNNVFINPVTEIDQKKGSYLEMDTSQIGGVFQSKRVTKAVLAEDASLVIKESLLTEGEESLDTEFVVDLNGKGSGVNLSSRSVAKDKSIQNYKSIIRGNNACTGHSACDAIIVGKGKVNASPELTANHGDAMLIHEAAIGKIAGDQIIKLQTLGLTEEEAEERILQSFLQS